MYQNKREWRPVLPKPGTYFDWQQGEITLTDAIYDDLVIRFNQEQLPLPRLPVTIGPFSHARVLAGAIVELRRPRSGIVEARFAWNDDVESTFTTGKYEILPSLIHNYRDPTQRIVIPWLLTGAAIVPPNHVPALRQAWVLG